MRIGAKLPNSGPLPLEAGIARMARALEDAGFEVDVREDTTTPSEKGIVLSQDPSGGDEASEGSTVTITVSDYEEPDSPSPTPTPSETPTPTDTPTASPSGSTAASAGPPTGKPSPGQGRR